MSEPAKKAKAAVSGFQYEARKDFLSFDGGVRATGGLVVPNGNNLKDLQSIEHKVLSEKAPRIPMGAGLSFASPQFGEGVVSVDHRPFTGVLGFDSETGLVEVEAGCTMAHLYNYLITKGRYLATQPGYPSITVGGCIAVDVHGKNQMRDGTCIKQVAALKLYHPVYGVLEASPEVNREAFELTCGGYGLTGHILSAILKTKPVSSRKMALLKIPFDDVLETPRILKECARNNDFVVSWHDLTASGKAFGSGFLIMGKFFSEDQDPKAFVKEMSTKWQLDAHARRWEGLPTFGTSFYSLPFTRLMNVLYGHVSRGKRDADTIAIYDCLQPMTTLREFYYKMFGSAGFHECQLIIPDEDFAYYIERIRYAIAKFEIPVTLASGKYFTGTSSLLRFDGTGVCFALNFPRCEPGRKFIEFLDELTIERAYLPYIVKDSRLPLNVVAETYGDNYLDFRNRLRAFDPDRLFQSEVSRRLEL